MLRHLVVVVLVALAVALTASPTQAFAAPDEEVLQLGGKCPADQFVCGKERNIWACCGAHAVCCQKVGGNAHCGYGLHPCR